MKLLRRKFLKLSYFFSLALLTGLVNFKTSKRNKYVWYLNESDK